MTTLQNIVFKILIIISYYLYHLLAMNQPTRGNLFLENCILIAYQRNETEKSKNRVDQNQHGLTYNTPFTCWKPKNDKVLHARLLFPLVTNQRKVNRCTAGLLKRKGSERFRGIAGLSPNYFLLNFT